MGNRLITSQEAARDLHEVIQRVIAEALYAGVPLDTINSAVNCLFATLGGFPPESHQGETQR